MKKHVILLLSLVGMLMIGASLQAKDKVVVIPLSGGKQVPTNIVTVAKSGGDFTDLQEAINSITDASEENPYLIVMAPGVYEIEQTIIMKDYVSITGSGRYETQLVGQIGTSSIETSAIINGAYDVALSNINVMNRGNDQSHTEFSIGIYCDHVYMRLKNVVVEVSASSHGADFVRAVANLNHSRLSVGDSFLVAWGTDSVGLYNSDNSWSRVNSSKLYGSGGNGSHGVRTGHSATKIINTEITRSPIDTTPNEKQCLYTYDSQLNEVNC